jgi:hypothetical protein
MPPPTVIDPPSWLLAGTKGAFRTIAGLRSARGLHPKGTTFAGRADVHPAGRSLAEPGSGTRVIVRLSRGIGLPHPWPDFNGVAIRFLDARGDGRHQDVLLTTSFAAPVLRRAIFPWPTFAVLGYSSVLSFDTEEGVLMLRVEPLATPTLDTAETDLPLEVVLRIAEPRGTWSDAATVTLDRVLTPNEAAEVRFDPWTTTETFTPRGLLNRLRGPAYEGSREAAPDVA